MEFPLKAASRRTSDHRAGNAWGGWIVRSGLTQQAFQIVVMPGIDEMADHAPLDRPYRLQQILCRGPCELQMPAERAHQLVEIGTGRDHSTASSATRPDEVPRLENAQHLPAGSPSEIEFLLELVDMSDELPHWPALQHQTLFEQHGGVGCRLG